MCVYVLVTDLRKKENGNRNRYIRLKKNNNQKLGLAKKIAVGASQNTSTASASKSTLCQ